jgi:hypothetical protein
VYSANLKFASTIMHVKSPFNRSHPPPCDPHRASRLALTANESPYLPAPARWAESSDFRFWICDFGLRSHRITRSALANTFGGIHLKKIQNPNIEIRNKRTRKRTLSSRAPLYSFAVGRFDLF